MDNQRRHVVLKGSSNLRDIGGYPAAAGHSVKWGRVFRSGALWGLRDEDWSWFDAQGISIICDLRSREERQIAPTRWRGAAPARFVDHGYEGAVLFGRATHEQRGIGAIAGELYVGFAQLLAPSLRGFFQSLEEGEGPAIVHCSAGQDRTGLAVALLLTALGVDRSVIYADYLLSTELRRPEHELDHALLGSMADANVVAAFYADLLARSGPDALKPRALVDNAGQPLLRIAFEAIEQKWGSIATYLEVELGMGEEQVRNLRAHLLEPAHDRSHAAGAI